MNTRPLRNLGIVLTEEFERLLLMPKQLDTVSRELQEIKDQQRELLEELKSNRHDLARLSGSFQELSVRDDTLTHASRQCELLSEEHYQQHVIEPLARGLIAALDILRDANDSSPSESAYPLVEGLRAQLESLLGQFGIEPIDVRIGAPFDPRLMKPLARVPALDASEQNTIREVRQVGFCRGDRVIRPASVVILS